MDEPELLLSDFFLMFLKIGYKSWIQNEFNHF